MGTSHSKQTKALANKSKMTGPRIWIPLEVLQCKAYASLSITAKALFIDLAAQLRGKFGEVRNNGDLTTALRVLANRGWKSDKTIRRAAKELENVLLIVKTRQGHLPNKSNLYAVTWLELNENPKFDITKIGFPYKGYLKY
jgi:hypothetical protein